MLSVIQETQQDFLKDLGLSDHNFARLDQLVSGDSKYLKDLRINLKTALQSENVTSKEAYLIALSAAVNEENNTLTDAFRTLAANHGATEAELAEAVAVTSLLSTNNILYRFKHFMHTDFYESAAPKVKMNIMMNPVGGKEFFELVSLAISAINGCERCVTSHEESVRKLGASEQRIFDAVRIAAVVVGVSKVIR